ncbi:hypothetical protein MAPG_09844 [Magnaporthiopsis poae ATCC 64411]|uniref:G domain-containing protein n=1 Tax=Magnaporthiopsis poae (strain ATCC 64411 / 73-15) TaxID=644358 RepID=A0A0C4EB04_MAGP6|nr:hypothetical protein MAPG_09844 [Magnaporthiopsis poae ATCC 64411]
MVSTAVAQALRWFSHLPRRLKMSSPGDESCSCGQPPTNVLLIGCTQHGKSSVIRSLYDYAGHGQAGDAVKIGSHGNSSTTKECSVYPLTVKLREHFLKDVNGKALSIDNADEVGDAEDLADEYYPAPSQDGDNDTGGEMASAIRHETTHTGEHLHLRLIDTPGLDDSDGGPKAARDGGANTTHMNVEDEKHKMAIYRAIAEAGSINSVCFIVSSEANLGATLPRILREYKELFRAMGVGGNTHVLHTRVNQYDMWNKMQTRPHAVSTAICDWTAPHALINNLPDGVVAEYLAQTSLAGLLKRIALDSPQPVPDLGYPKSHAHRAMEAQIRDAMQAGLAGWQHKIKQEQKQIDELEIQRVGLEARHSKQMDIWRELNSEYERLDTCDEVEIRDFHGWAAWSFLFVPARMDVHLSTDHPIRNIRRDTPDHARWEGPGDDHWRNSGGRHFAETLVAHGIFTNIWATVWLYGWRKDIEAGRLSTLHAERDEAWYAHAGTRERICEIERDMARRKGVKEELERSRDAVEARIAELQADRIPLQVIQERGHYLGTASVISYSYGMGITEDVLDMSLLPTAPDASAKSAALEKYRGRVEELGKDKTEQTQLEGPYKAAEAMVNVVLARDTCRAGLFAALTMSIAQFGHDSEAVWERIFAELEECYTKDSQNWDRFVELL